MKQDVDLNITVQSRLCYLLLFVEHISKINIYSYLGFLEEKNEIGYEKMWLVMNSQEGFLYFVFGSPSCEIIKSEKFCQQSLPFLGQGTTI